MEAEIHYTCPNCGANISNALNCEYCGSLLVRFVEKKIDLSQTTYLNDDYNCVGLRHALQQNLSLQKSTQGIVTTDVYAELDYTNGKRGLICSIMPSGMSKLGGTGADNHFTQCGLAVSFYFETIVSFPLQTTEVLNRKKEINREEEKRMKMFRALDCAALFKRRVKFISKTVSKIKVTEYYIDFGEDVKGATRLISKIMREVYEAPQDGLQYETNEGVGDRYKGKGALIALSQDKSIIYFVLGFIVSIYLFINVDKSLGMIAMASATGMAGNSARVK